MCYCHYIAFNYFSSLEKWQVLPGHVQPRSSRAATDQDEEVDEEVFGERCGHQGAGQDVHLEPLHQQPLLHRAHRWEELMNIFLIFGICR